MDEVKKWSITVSAVSIISGVVSSMLPENTYKILFRFVAGIVLVYTIIQPLLGKTIVDFDVSDYLKENYEVSEMADKYALGAMLSSAEKAIEDIFTDYSAEIDTEFDVKCKCEVVDDAVRIKEIAFTGHLSEEEINKIKKFAVESGFDKSVLVFIGD